MLEKKRLLFFLAFPFTLCIFLAYSFFVDLSRNQHQLRFSTYDRLYQFFSSNSLLAGDILPFLKDEVYIRDGRRLLVLNPSFSFHLARMDREELKTVTSLNHRKVDAVLSKESPYYSEEVDFIQIADEGDRLEGEWYVGSQTIVKRVEEAYRSRKELDFILSFFSSGAFKRERSHQLLQNGVEKFRNSLKGFRMDVQNWTELKKDISDIEAIKMSTDNKLFREVCLALLFMAFNYFVLYLFVFGHYKSSFQVHRIFGSYGRIYLRVLSDLGWMFPITIVTLIFAKLIYALALQQLNIDGVLLLLGILTLYHVVACSLAYLLVFPRGRYIKEAYV